jgi:predicted nuclease with TOPRIM domain
MNFTEEIITVGKDRATRIKAFLEELELQTALGKAEAKDAIEEEKKNFQKFLRKYKSQIHEVEDESIEQVRELNDKFAVLAAKVNLPMPDNKRKFDQYKNETLHAVYDLELALKEKYGEVSEELMGRLDAFKDKLDAYRIQLAFTEFKHEEELKERKTELLDAINEIRDKLQEKVEAGAKLEHFVEDISDSFEKMKKAFSDLFA